MLCRFAWHQWASKDVLFPKEVVHTMELMVLDKLCWDLHSVTSTSYVPVLLGHVLRSWKPCIHPYRCRCVIALVISRRFSLKLADVYTHFGLSALADWVFYDLNTRSNGLNTYDMNTYDLDTYDMDTYGLNTYGLNTYGLNTYGMNTYDLNT